MFGDITVYHMGTRTWAPLGRKRVCHSSASSVRRVAALGGPAGDSLGGSALGQCAGVLQPMGCKCVEASEKTSVLGCPGRPPPPRTLRRRPDHCPVIAEGQSPRTTQGTRPRRWKPVSGEGRGGPRDGGQEAAPCSCEQLPQNVLLQDPVPLGSAISCKAGAGGQCHVPGHPSQSPSIHGTGEASSLSMVQLCCRT